MLIIIIIVSARTPNGSEITNIAKQDLLTTFNEKEGLKQNSLNNLLTS